MATSIEVDRVGDALDWTVVADGVPAGTATVWLRPDDRAYVFFREVLAEAHGPMLAAIDRDLGASLFTEVDADDTERIATLHANGFVPHRRESHYVMPVEDAVTAAGAAAFPPGYVLANVADLAEADLRRLDDALRQDVPGTDGWEWDEAGFREETYEAAAFDPQLYWLAVEEVTGDPVGIVRVWNRPQAPRLGLIAVLPRHRRRGVSRALLAHVFQILQQRGVTEVVTEIDDTNLASRGLLAGLGARAVGGSVELLRESAAASP